MGSPVPGYETVRAVTPREFLHTIEGAVYVPAGVPISGAGAYDGSNTGFEKELRAGWWMGRITSGAEAGKFRPCTRTQVNGTSGAATAVVVDNAAAFKVGDVITIGADVDITITAINYSTNTLTIASTTVADNDVVFCQDGSGVPVGILGEFVNLRNPENNANRDMTGKLLVEGKVVQQQLLGDTAAILALTAAQLAAVSGAIKVWSNTAGAYVGV